MRAWKRRLSDDERSVLLSELLLRHPELVAEAREITSTLLFVDDQELADKISARRGGQAVAGMLPAVALVRLGIPALAAVVFLAVLVLAVICWVISSADRTDRVNRMMLARQGNARCLTPTSSAPSVPAARSRRQSVGSGRSPTKAPAA